MHITSLPSPYGIGSMGKAAYDFIDFLKEAKQTYWQILPINPPGYGDSPYQAFSTFAGNPLGAAAALATLDTIENEHLVENAEERGEQLRQGIMASGNPLFTSVRGRGLLNAILLSHRCSHAAMNWALEHGLIVNAVAPDALRLAPPLIVSEQEIDEAVSILAKIPTDLPND